MSDNNNNADATTDIGHAISSTDDECNNFLTPIDGELLIRLSNKGRSNDDNDKEEEEEKEEG